jgi:hypothetical protein
MVKCSEEFFTVIAIIVCVVSRRREKRANLTNYRSIFFVDDDDTDNTLPMIAMQNARCTVARSVLSRRVDRLEGAERRCRQEIRYRSQSRYDRCGLN